MTRIYAATRLFELGPLTFAEFTEITGWSRAQADKTMIKLLEVGIVEFFNTPQNRRRCYRLA